jgi:hypothetical protein
MFDKLPKETPTDKCRKSEYSHNLKQHRELRVYAMQPESSKTSQLSAQIGLDDLRVTAQVFAWSLERYRAAFHDVREVGNLQG